MRPLLPGDRRWGRSNRSREGRFHLDVQVLAMQTQTGMPLVSPVPVPPEQRSRSHRQGMKQDAHLARFRRCTAVPLALLTQRTRAAGPNTGPIDHTQALISFSATFMRQERVPSRAAQRPIWLEGKVSSCEVVSFPGRGGGGWRIS